jgi:hypothetical protein
MNPMNSNVYGEVSQKEKKCMVNGREKLVAGFCPPLAEVARSAGGGEVSLCLVAGTEKETMSDRR